MFSDTPELFAWRASMIFDELTAFLNLASILSGRFTDGQNLQPWLNTWTVNIKVMNLGRYVINLEIILCAILSKEFISNLEIRSQMCNRIEYQNLIAVVKISVQEIYFILYYFFHNLWLRVNCFSFIIVYQQGLHETIFQLLNKK